MSEKGSLICSVNVVDQEKIQKLEQILPDKEMTKKMAEIFKALADPTRLHIVQALLEEELCVCDISAVVNLSISAISHQLRLLRTMHIVKFRKQGKMVYYSLDDDHITLLVQTALEHVQEKTGESVRA
ncbi:MAG TPA: ArsR family transcriptional regulator [Caldithrix abyssi]|uniref:ArsR family transcriptional regulator n=1 Tax=Caldithrix abyssi TaxID=187145 RepID=A0A7V5LJC1_CALAY|nr:winged helix-turn-helix transcriptional regulator [Caldisericaceae bacterium]HHE55346.1 ArsR family transcriptional regulator [Caldithrix abyssi]